MSETVGGRYRLMRLLGEGSQGATWEAIGTKNGDRKVAIKRFEVRGAKQWKDVELAEREARVLASLSHPLLPAYVEHFEEDGVLYLVMERIEGVSLVEFTKRGGVFDESDVRSFLEHAARALDHLHSRTPPIIHRDLKPRNCIRRPDGSFAFVDFGAVRDKLKPQGGSTVVGTYGYMAPEQFQGRAVPASDVYAVGATALWMLVGLEPEELPHEGLAIDVEKSLGPRANPDLVTVLRAMLEPDPDKRPRSIAPLLAGFEVRGRQVRVGVASVASRPPSRPPPSEPPTTTGTAVESHAITALRIARRFLPLLWIGAALAWWALPSSTALSFTIGLLVLSVGVRLYRPAEERRRFRPRRYPRHPAVRVPEMETETERESDDEEERARRLRR